MYDYAGGAGQAVTPGGFEEYRDLVVHKRVIEDSSSQMELIRLGLSFSRPKLLFVLCVCVFLSVALVLVWRVVFLSFFTVTRHRTLRNRTG